MAFKKPYLQCVQRFSSSDLLAAQNGLWFYTTADAVSVVEAAGYFNNARTELATGDVITANCNGTIRHLLPTCPADGVSNVTVADAGSSGKVIAAGQATTVAAVDTIVTGLGVLTSVVASLDSDPVDDPEWVTASIGDQAGTPAAGSFLLKTWKNTAGNDPTPLAAGTFGKKVNWIAFGKLA